MHALTWHQSAGEPWSFTVPRERQQQLYRTVRDAVQAARETQNADTTIRIGLTCPSANRRSAMADAQKSDAPIARQPPAPPHANDFVRAQRSPP